MGRRLTFLIGKAAITLNTAYIQEFTALLPDSDGLVCASAVQGAFPSSSDLLVLWSSCTLTACSLSLYLPQSTAL